jgi:transposase
MPDQRRTKHTYFNGRPFGKSSSLPDIRLDETKVIGSLYLFKPLLEKLGLKEAVDTVVPMQRDIAGGITHGQVLEQLIINRLDAPCPLVDIEYWAHERCVEAVYGIPSEKLNDDRVGRALDAMSEYTSDIEDIIVLKALSHFNIDPKLILWDTTSFYFEGDYDASELITLGYSRDQKKDKKQVVVELNITAEGGIPLAHRILPGNASDRTEAVQNLDKIKSKLKNRDMVVIGDRAMFTKENMVTLLDKKISFLGPSCAMEREYILSVPDNLFTPLRYTTSGGKGGYSGVEIDHHSFTHKGKEYWIRTLVVKSEDLFRQQQKTLVRQLGVIEARLQEITEQLNNRKFKDKTYAAGQIEKAFSRHKELRHLFNINLEGSDGQLSLTWGYDRVAIDEENRLLGKYMLVTNLNQKDYDADQLLELYKSRHQIESRFRSLKNDLKIRPIFLQSEERIKSLILVNILALLVYSLLEWICQRNKLATSGRDALDIFRLPTIVTLTFQGQTIRQIGNVSSQAEQVMAVMKLGPPDPV